MPQSPSRRKIEADWANPAGENANEQGPGNVDEFIGEYLWNTNRWRECMLVKDNYDYSYADWCGRQAEYVVAR